MVCPRCGTENPDSIKFCGECGARLKDSTAQSLGGAVESRKQVTVFFSDLSGYTAMSEKLDAEEVKEIMQRIFSQAASVVRKYAGHIDKFIGDCVMVVFGFPIARDDDAVRALNAALEIHAVVEEMNTPELIERIGRTLAMHTGMNTGMAVIGELDIERGAEKILGDTVNVASRLSGVAVRGEIVVGKDTYAAASRHFDFKEMPPLKVKGKAEELAAFKVIGRKKEKAERPRGRKAALVGRDQELSLLVDAAKDLEAGRGTVVSISGEAGSGKSRLISELKARFRPSDGFSWHEAFAQAHTANVAYALWIDFLNRLLSIEESDSKESLRAKVRGVCDSHGAPERSIPFISVLYSLSTPETQGMDPGSLRIEIGRSIAAVVSAVAAGGRTIFYFDDMHWADPSSIEILQSVLKGMTAPAVFMCVHRPGVRLFEDISTADAIHHGFVQIALTELDSGDEERMIASLLAAESVPRELVRYVSRNIAGNPFYIEEIVNNLIETKILSRSGNEWTMTRPLRETDVPLTVEAVIEARIDRLEPVPKRVLQTASVIGRTFLYSLLKTVAELEAGFDECLSRLESADVIRLLGREPELSYLFKHAILQDVVYNSLLRKEQRASHLRIAQIMESVFRERIEEFYEAIALHYRKSGASDRAVEYLIKAGRKSMASYASEEADAFYRHAYELLVERKERCGEENLLLVKLLTDWGFAHYSLGTFADWADIFERHVQEADSISDQGIRALFHAGLGFAIFEARLDIDASNEHLRKAIKIAERSGNRRALAYAHCWYSSACGTQGNLVDGIEHGEIGMELAEGIPDDPYLYGKSGFGKAGCLAFQGKAQQARRTAELVLAYGHKNNNSRCLSLAYSVLGDNEYYNGNSRNALEIYEKSIASSPEPMYRYMSSTNMSAALIAEGRLDEAEKLLNRCEAFFSTNRGKFFTMEIKSFQALLLFRKSQFSKAFRHLKGIRTTWNQAKCFYPIALVEYTLGTIYLEMLHGNTKVPLSVVLRNLSFIVANAPFAYRRAKQSFERSYEVAKAHGIFGIHGRSALELGVLLKARNPERAGEYLHEALEVLRKTDLLDDIERAEREIKKQ